MENQHRKISGYRELTQEEIDLMNEIKEKGRELNQLVGRTPITLMDAATIKAVQDGKREISIGYDMELDWTPGTTSEGQAYDAVMKNLRRNHCWNGA